VLAKDDDWRTPPKHLIPARGRYVAPLVWTVLLLALALPASAAADPAGEVKGTVAPIGVSLTGSTIDALGRSIGGVEVRLHTTHPGTGRLVLRTAESDRHGRFLIGDLAPGLYRVIAVKGGYAVLVGQINTLYEKTLELILRPAREDGAPGSIPDSAAWALRLPQRDPLEEHDFVLETATRIDPSPAGRGLSLPLRLELVASHRDGSYSSEDLSAAGLAAEIASTFELANAGFVGMSYRHQRDADSSESADRFDSVHARFVPRPGEGEFPVVFKLDAERQRRDRAASTMFREAHVLSEGARLRARWTGAGSEGAVTAALDAAMLSALQDVGDPGFDVGLDDDRFRASRVDLELAGRRSWGEDHETSYKLMLRSVSGGLAEPVGGEASLALVPLVAEVERAVLGTLASTTVDLRLENRWLAEAIGADMRTRVRLEHGSEQADDVRGSAAVGTTFGVSPGVVLDLDGGVGVLDTGGTVPIWTAELSGGGERFAWSIASRSEVGIAVWRSKHGADDTFEAVLPVVTDRSGRIDGWSASATWRQRDGWPEVRMTGETFEVTGAIAAYLPGDLPWVPIDSEGSGIGAAVDLHIDVPRTGTFVGLAWSEIEDRGVERVLLSGADGWVWRQLNVRQRLAQSDWRGATWQLVVGVEHGRVSRPDALDDDSPRLAFLSQRRISGGVALAF